MWPDPRFLALVGVEHPIIQAPMAGAMSAEMVIAVSEAGGLGSLPCALLAVDQARRELGEIRRKTSKPINVNFFCHPHPKLDAAREAVWRRRLAGYYVELGVDPNAPVGASSRAPFDGAMCDLVAEFEPEIVSFHFGLPEKSLLARVRRTGAKV